MANRVMWFNRDAAEVAAGIFDELSLIQQEQRERYNRNIRCLKLYGSYDYTGLFPSTSAQNTFLPENRVRYNLIASCIDTICSKVSKIKPKITFLTDGGAWESQEKSKLLTKFILGLFTQNKIWKQHQMGFKDSTIFDIGAIKHYRIENKIMSERVLPTELHFDRVDSVYGSPKLLYQAKNIDKSELVSLYPNKKKLIMASSVSAEPNTPITLDLSGQATVVEAWKLPSVPGGDDGRHTIACDKGVLFDEEWKYDDFPFTFFRWAEMPVGAYGQSLADRLTGNQVEINKMLRVIQRSMHLGSVFKVFLEYGSKVVKEQMNNEIGGFVYYNGTMPQVVIPKVVSQEMFQYLAWLIDKGYEETGVSQLSAAAKRPSGVDAKVAMRELQDIETDRFALTSINYEDSFDSTATWYIRLAKEIDEEGMEVEAVAESKKFVEKIKWSDIQIDENSMIIKKFPTSTLPNTPAGKLQYVQEMMEAGLIDPVMGKRLLDFPDTESVISLDVAALDTIFYCIDSILTKGKYTPPEPYMDLASGLKYMQAAYNRGIVDEVPEDKLDMMREWMAQANQMIQAATPPPPEAQVPPEQPAPLENMPLQ